MNEEYYSLQRIILSKISSGVHPTIGPSYIRKIVTNEDKLDQMPIVEIERLSTKEKIRKIKKYKRMKVLLIDMDGVVVDLNLHIKEFFERYPYLHSKYENCPDHIPGIFRNPKPYPGAVEAINKLYESGKYDMYIATAAPWGNPDAATDKRYWIETYFGNMFHKRLILTHRKDMLKGDILIDDREKNGAGEFEGELIRFGYNHITDSMNEYQDWNAVLEHLL